MFQNSSHLLETKTTVEQITNNRKVKYIFFQKKEIGADQNHNGAGHYVLR